MQTPGSFMIFLDLIFFNFVQIPLTKSTKFPFSKSKAILLSVCKSIICTKQLVPFITYLVLKWLKKTIISSSAFH